MHDISGESWREANNIQESLSTLMQLDSSILSPQKPGVKSKIIVNNWMISLKTLALILLMSIMMIVWKVYYLVTLFSEEDDYDHEEGYSQGFDTSEEESLTSEMDDNFETLIKNIILEVSCDEIPPCTPPDDKLSCARPSDRRRGRDEHQKKWANRPINTNKD